MHYTIIHHQTFVPNIQTKEMEQRSCKYRQQGTDFAMAPFINEKENSRIQLKQISMSETPTDGASYHAIKF